MKLIVKRDQADRKGVFGGHKGMNFLLAFRVELTSAEQELVTQYRTEREMIAFIPLKTESIKVIEGNGAGVLQIADMLKGQVYQCADVATMPYEVFSKLVKHPLTDSGLERFLSDWKKLEQSLKEGA